MATLAVTLGGCWCDVPDEIRDTPISGTVSGDELEMVRSENPDAPTRCVAACRVALANGGVDPDDDDNNGEYDEFVNCTVQGMEGGPADPWDPAHTEITVSCDGRTVRPGFCTGRRPLGHHELAMRSRSHAQWLRVHAHLERASITAFEQLAVWLANHGAPDELRARCVAAAADEVVHAQLLEGLLRAEGLEPASALVDAGAPEDLLSVAMHNAVEGCVSEAFAATIAAYQSEHADSPELRGVFAQIAQDELRHGQLAWDLHAWFMAQLDEVSQARVRAAQRQAMLALADVAATNAAASPAGVGWPSPELATIMAQSFARGVNAQLDGALRMAG
ncbi:putative lipoprotein [Enhygromyxa salina]|uniref:Putative lipoprotein n=1 Tax=Enhygromyxa salina TaxID=215803 RepID=A0A0C2A0P5_9BACT|nr:ferritin-like domain-containing protein [Enhygromyxa salina]KIG16973.1 putative lipoprotein [Enhygromyxa salina]